MRQGESDEGPLRTAWVCLQPCLYPRATDPVGQLLGKTGKNAPTYAASVAPKSVESVERSIKMKKYVCQVCGYVYDPAAGDPDNGKVLDQPIRVDYPLLLLRAYIGNE